MSALIAGITRFTYNTTFSLCVDINQEHRHTCIIVDRNFRKWRDQYEEAVLEVARKEYKDHVNEIKKLSIAMKNGLLLMIGIPESLSNYLSPGECSRKSKSVSSGSKSQPCISEQRLEIFGRLFWSKFSLVSSISKLQSALSPVGDCLVFLNGVFKKRSSYATVRNRHVTIYPCLKVLFEKGEGDLTLIDYSDDVQNIDPFLDFYALEKYLWPKVCSSDTKGVDQTGSSGQSSSDSIQQNIR
ncbi:hypothetical protein Tco_0586726 [Tanacetum coccineum]